MQRYFSHPILESRVLLSTAFYLLNLSESLQSLVSSVLQSHRCHRMNRGEAPYACVVSYVANAASGRILHKPQEGQE